jgi:hypothetical protein
VDVTNKAFDEVAKSAEQVTQLVGEIAAASSEQAQGIEQVNSSVHNIIVKPHVLVAYLFFCQTDLLFPTFLDKFN